VIKNLIKAACVGDVVRPGGWHGHILDPAVN